MYTNIISIVYVCRLEQLMVIKFPSVNLANTFNLNILEYLKYKL